MELRRPRVLALVLAGGEGGRLDVLTEERAKPAMPFAGVYRLIDFTLSNLRNSGISDVWVIQQYEPHSLTEHLANGRPWDLDRTHGGMRVLHPHLGRSESGFYEGNADAIFRSKADIRAFEPDLLLVMSADHVYTLDLARVVAEHVESGADATLVTTRVPQEEAERFGVVQVGDGGEIERYDYKPDEPEGDIVATEVFLFGAERILAGLEDLADGDDDSGLEDLGDDFLPQLVEEGDVREHRLDGYWRDVGTAESYWEGHMEFLGADPPLDLGDPAWPILTWAVTHPPARISGTGVVEESLVSPGCTIHGQVVHSVLAPGVCVEEGAEVRDAVVLHDAVIRSGGRVERAIVDEQAEILAPVGEAHGEIALVGRGARVTDPVEAGGRVKPHSGS